MREQLSDEAIVRDLARRRTREFLSLEMNRFPNCLFHKVGDASTAAPETEVSVLCPPMATILPWLESREHVGRSREQILCLELERRMLRALRTRDQSEPWARALRAYVEVLQERAFGGCLDEIKPRDIVFKLKTPGIYRPIVRYGLCEAVLECAAARHLRGVFDLDFLSNVLSFRGPTAPPRCSRTGGVSEIVAYRRAHGGTTLWVAEIDLKACYDCIHADIVRELVVEALERAARQGRLIDPFALAILDKYLAGYSFPGFVLPRARAWLMANDPEGTIAWPKNDLDRRWGNAETAPLGIAQGGALSNLVLNVVLDLADRAVMQNAAPGLFYRRFADDMILIHPDEDVVRGALERYLEALERLGLPRHPPPPSRKYSEKHWTSKSRGPYQWKKSASSGSSPYVGFLGYEVRYDGDVRIRRSSIAKECTRIEQVADRALRAARRQTADRTTSGGPYPGDQILFRVEQWMIHHMIGFAGHRRRCWRGAFSLVVIGHVNRDQFKFLDRHRERVLRRLARGLDEFAAVSPPGPQRPWGRGGYKTSYVGAFTAVGNIDRVRGPQGRDPFTSKRRKP